MQNHQIEKLNEIFKKFTLEEAFDNLVNLGFKNMAFSTSFGQEDQVIRLFEETYKVIDQTQKKYNKQVLSYFPNTESVEKLVAEKGHFSFYDSIENRKECCLIRKVNPLQRALKGVDLWITGLRAAQSNSRSKVNLFGYDDAFGLPKFNPLAHWDLSTVKKYLENNQVPQNILHKKGFLSIGCAPCTRAIRQGDDIRSGRWWWEESKKECGLHLNQKS